MVKRRAQWLVLLSSLVMILVIAGCGGGGGSAQQATVSGVAATGAPLVGTVYLKDSSTPTKELSTPIGTDGKFSFDVTGLKAPYILKAVGTANNQSYTLYSFASDKGTTNINPFTHLALVQANGSDDLGTLYGAPDTGKMLLVKEKILIAVSQVRQALNALLQEYGVANVNFLSDSYTANHQGLDLLFDMVVIDFTSGNVSIKDRTTHGVIFTSVSNNVLSGTVDVSVIPPPPVKIPVAVFLNGDDVTVTANGTVSFVAAVSGTTNQGVTWTVVENGGGVISSTGRYTAPATAGTYHVTATSVADTTKSATATVTVTAAPVTNTQQIWKTDSTVTPSVTVTIGPALGTTTSAFGNIVYHSGTVQCSALTGGSATVTGISDTAYITTYFDGSILIWITDGNKFVMIVTDSNPSNSTTVNAYVSVSNGVSTVFSGSANLVKQ